MGEAPGKPRPEATPVSAPFWEALRERRVMIQYSPSSDKYVFYPRILAPGTLADDLQWREISGEGELYSYTITDRPTAPPWADSVPQFLAIVRWDAGPSVSTELVNVAAEDIAIGMRVRPVFRDVEDGMTLLLYEPA